MNTVVNIIDACTSIDEEGFYKIKALEDIANSGVELDSINRVKLWDAVKHSANYNRPILFGDSTWISNEPTNRNLSFIGDYSEFDFQLRMFALVRYSVGVVDGGNTEKLSTLQGKVTALKRMASFLKEKGIKSFHHLKDSSDLHLRTILSEFISEWFEKNKPNAKPRVFDDFFNPRGSLGLIDARTSEYLNDVLGEHFNSESNSLSHPIIPTQISRNIAKFANMIIRDCETKLDAFEAINDQFMTDLVNDKESISSRTWKVADFLNNKARSLGIHLRLHELHAYFVDLRLGVYIHILHYTGMRYNEALSCKNGCANKSNPDEGLYVVEALTFKTADQTVLDTWVANKDTCRAIAVLERYNRIMMSRANTLIKHFDKVLSEDQIHNLKFGLEQNLLFGTVSSAASISFAKSGRFADFKVNSPHFIKHWDLTITDEAIEELERLDLNYSQMRGEDRGKPYDVGDLLRISAHMFRHTFAYFVVANKLGEFDDVGSQFKHLDQAMIRVYADKGILSHEELVQLVEDFEKNLTEHIAIELADQAQQGTLRGGAGERFNKAAHELVIGVTDSNSQNANVIQQIHFKNIKQFHQFLAKNVKTIRGLPGGYCTAGDDCKLSGASAPSSCVYCKSYVAAERHRPYWRAIQKRATEKLAAIKKLPKEKQQEFELFSIMFKKDIKASEYILNEIQALDKGEAV